MEWKFVNVCEKLQWDENCKISDFWKLNEIVHRQIFTLQYYKLEISVRVNSKVAERTNFSIN